MHQLDLKVTKRETNIKERKIPWTYQTKKIEQKHTYKHKLPLCPCTEILRLKGKFVNYNYIPIQKITIISMYRKLQLCPCTENLRLKGKFVNFGKNLNIYAWIRFPFSGIMKKLEYICFYK